VDNRSEVKASEKRVRDGEGEAQSSTRSVLQNALSDMQDSDFDDLASVVSFLAPPPKLPVSNPFLRY